MLVNIPAPWSITGSGKLDLDHVGTVSYLDMKHEICGKKLGMNSEVPSFDQPCFFFPGRVWICLDSNQCTSRGCSSTTFHMSFAVPKLWP